MGAEKVRTKCGSRVKFCLRVVNLPEFGGMNRQMISTLESAGFRAGVDYTRVDRTQDFRNGRGFFYAGAPEFVVERTKDEFNFIDGRWEKRENVRRYDFYSLGSVPHLLAA